jgi:GT2 family glycosyltransferase
MIFILVPVHNRIDRLRTFIADLERQQHAPEFTLVVVDSGSSDGTSEFISRMAASLSMRQGTLFPVIGAADWWWSRAVEEGIDRISADLTSMDKVLIINDDVSLEPTYLRKISDLSDAEPTSLVTSCLVAPSDLSCAPFHFGVAVDLDRLTFHDITPSANWDARTVIRSDVASGRGTLFPASAMLAGVRPRTRKLPHYLADYDMGLQARRLGYSIVGRPDIYVVTERIQGNSRRFSTRWQYRTRLESPGRLLTWWHFWRSETLGLSTLRLLGRVVARRMNGSNIG